MAWLAGCSYTTFLKTKFTTGHFSLQLFLHMNKLVKLGGYIIFLFAFYAECTIRDRQKNTTTSKENGIPIKCIPLVTHIYFFSL